MAYNRKLKPHKQAPYMASEVTTNRLTEPATEQQKIQQPAANRNAENAQQEGQKLTSTTVLDSTPILCFNLFRVLLIHPPFTYKNCFYLRVVFTVSRYRACFFQLKNNVILTFYNLEILYIKKHNLFCLFIVIKG